MKLKKLSLVEDYLYLRIAKDEIIKLDFEGKILERNCAQTFLYASAPEQELSDPAKMALGIIGEGCGGNRVFICDTSKNVVNVYNLEDQSSQKLIEDISAPEGICKVRCELYISSAIDNKIYIYNLSTLSMREFCF